MKGTATESSLSLTDNKSTLSASVEGGTHSSSSSSLLPDFSSKHQQYTRGLLKGRHPRSFPKQSELWHHYKSSASRLDRVVKGHNLWNVVDEQDSSQDQLLSPTSEGGSAQQHVAKTGSGLHTTSSSARYIPKSTLHGIHVDTKGVMKMHYGMNIVLMNCSDEVLCVNQFNEVLCKSEAMLDDGDEICFKVIDLTEPTNPGAIEYGKPIWLQTLRNNSNDNNIHYGFVLTSKLFGPPEMESTQLTQIQPNNKKTISLDQKKKEKASTAGLKSLSGMAIDSRRTSDMSELSNDSAAYDSSSDIIIESDESLSVNSYPAATKKPSKEDDLQLRRKEKDKKSSELSEVCGGIAVIRAYNNKGDVSPIDTDMTRFRSRQASHLGCWAVQNALKTGAPSKYVQSCTSIYLSQDLYCLATSHGNLYDPWPRTVEVNKVQAQLEKKKEAQRLSKLAESPFFSPSKTEKKTTGALGPGADDPKPRVIPTFTNNVPHGCLRRVVERGAPYSHTVDRRCVWKFCVADNPRDLKLLSVKEQKAHKLLRKAKAGLNKSKLNRLGGRVHEGYELDGEPLTGGEKFPRLLRNILSQESLKLETHDMLERRHKEEAISHHLRCLYEGSPTNYKEKLHHGSSNDELSVDSHEKHHDVFQKPRTAFNKIRSQLKRSVIPRHEFSENYQYTFGHEMLSIHQGFASVNNKVTGSIMKTSVQNALNNSEDMRRRRIAANVMENTPAATFDESIELLKSQKNATTYQGDPEALNKKLNLLSLTDDKVMLALHYQARLNNKVSIGNLFEDVLDDEDGK